MTLMMMAVILAVIPAAAAAEKQNLPTSNDETIVKMMMRFFLSYVTKWVVDHKAYLHDERRNLADEITEYTLALIYAAARQFTRDADNMTLTSLTNDLNSRCYEHLKQPLVNLREPLTNNRCVETRLRELLITKVKKAMELGLQGMRRDCFRDLLTLCPTNKSDCFETYEARLAQLTNDYLDDLNVFAEDVHYGTRRTAGDESQDFYRYLDVMPNNTYVYFITKVMLYYADATKDIFHYSKFQLSQLSQFFETPIEPFTIRNVINPWKRSFLYDKFLNTTSFKNLTWGVIKSSTGSVINSYSLYRDRKNHSRDILRDCYRMAYLESNSQLLVCSYSGPGPVSWSTGPPLFFNSQCLCVVSNGDHCSVKAPLGVDPLLYCFTVLLGDFQRQLRHRPAITYIDYAFQTRVPVCKLARFLSVSLSNVCRPMLNNTIKDAEAKQCVFNGLVNKQLSCSETLTIDSYDYTELCDIRFIMDLVSCDDEDEDDDVRVTYYGVGDSPLVLFLTYLDVAARFLTLMTYLVCPKLRNLPGKVLIGYMTTSLLRCVVVRATLDHLSLAVRLDACLDLASTLWLSAYLYCGKSQQPSDSLSTAQARQVLLRSALIAWVFPAALSTAFFLMDDALQTSIQVGQLMFVLCYYVALLANLYMFYVNVSFYHNTKRNTSQDLTRRDVLNYVFCYSVKTLILTGAGISIRLIVTQIPDMEHVLSCFHVVGILQGLLLFLFYGCCSEARDFWRNLLRRYHIIQETPQRRNFLELGVPLTATIQNK